MCNRTNGWLAIRIFTIFIFTIFIWAMSMLPATTVLAATPSPTPDLSETPLPDSEPTPEEIERSRQVEISLPPRARLQTDGSNPYFYHFRQALSFHGGLMSELGNLANPNATIGFQYRFQFPQNGRSEIGADLMTSGTGTIHASRFHFLDDQKFRFFYKYGVEVRVVPSEQLVTFLKLANWRGRAAVGLEWNASKAIGLRMDAQAHVGTAERFISMLAGLVYSF